MHVAGISLCVKLWSDPVLGGLSPVVFNSAVGMRSETSEYAKVLKISPRQTI